MSNYNGWKNRATWLVNVWGNPESKEDVEYLRESLEEEYHAMPNGILKDMIDIQEIDWDELLEHFDEENEHECNEYDNECNEDEDGEIQE